MNRQCFIFHGAYNISKYVMQASVHTPGSGYVLLHHVMGESDGERGIWSYVSLLLGWYFIMCIMWME